METVYRQGAAGYTSHKREFMPSNSSKPKAAVQKDTTSIPISESVSLNTSSEKDTKTEVPQTSLVLERKETLQNPTELPQPQHQPQSQSPPEIEAVKVESVMWLNDAQEPETSKKPPSSSTDDVLKRLLSLIETQSHTIEMQAQKIQWLEEQHSEVLRSLRSVEGKLEDLAGSKMTQGVDDDGAYIEI